MQVYSLATLEMTSTKAIWRKIPLTKTQIDLGTLLTCGQAFTWHETSDNIWSNVLNNIAFSLKQTPTEVLWCTPFRDQVTHISAADSEARDVKQLQEDKEVVSRKRKLTSNPKAAGAEDNEEVNYYYRGTKFDCSTSPSSTLASSNGSRSNPIFYEVTDEEAEAILRDYFQLNVDLPMLYKQWSLADKNFEKISNSFLGIRIMRQDPTENLFSFICSSNNHVSRISGMVNKLSEHYGVKLGTIGEKVMYSFPSAKDLDNPEVEGKLRELGFGYRYVYYCFRL